VPGSSPGGMKLLLTLHRTKQSMLAEVNRIIEEGFLARKKGICLYVIKSCNLQEQWLKTAKRIHLIWSIPVAHQLKQYPEQGLCIFSPLVSVNTYHYKNCLEFFSPDL